MTENRILCVTGKDKSHKLLVLDHEFNLLKETETDFLIMNLEMIGNTPYCYAFHYQKKNKCDYYAILLFKNQSEKIIEHKLDDRIIQIKNNDQFIVSYSKDKWFRIFRNEGQLSHKFDCSKQLLKDQEEIRDFSITNDNTILLSTGKMAYLVNLYGDILAKWEAPLITGYDWHDGICSTAVSADSKINFLGMYSGKLYCLNNQMNELWHTKVRDLISKIYLDEKGLFPIVKVIAKKPYISIILNRSKKIKIDRTSRIGHLNIRYIPSDGLIVLSIDEHLIFLNDKTGNLLNLMSFDKRILNLDYYNNKILVGTFDELFLFTFKFEKTNLLTNLIQTVNSFSKVSINSLIQSSKRDLIDEPERVPEVPSNFPKRVKRDRYLMDKVIFTIINEKKVPFIRCQICLKQYKNLTKNHLVGHSTTPAEYKKKYSKSLLKTKDNEGNFLPMEEGEGICKYCNALFSKKYLSKLYPQISEKKLHYCEGCMSGSTGTQIHLDNRNTYGNPAKSSAPFMRKEIFNELCDMDKDKVLGVFRDMISLAGFIPSQSYFENPKFRHDMLKKDVDKAIVLINQLGSLFHLDYWMSIDLPFIGHEFRAKKRKKISWFEFLIKLKVLDDKVWKGPRGTRCLANDGHVCNSIAEKNVDDWLYSHGIPHEKEPHYPEDDELNPNKLYRADWKIGNTLIEYFGLVGDKKYDQKVKVKIKIAKKQGFKLIELYQSDIPNLDKKLKAFIGK